MSFCSFALSSQPFNFYFLKTCKMLLLLSPTAFSPPLRNTQSCLVLLYNWLMLRILEIDIWSRYIYAITQLVFCERCKLLPLYDVIMIFCAFVLCIEYFLVLCTSCCTVPVHYMCIVQVTLYNAGLAR